ncbi:DUF6291 domain-containing protein, partial [uncultured Muribaculum sp.]
TLWGEMRGFGVIYLLKKVIMENATTKTSSRKGKNLKFDQEWKDAVDRLPKHYRDEICAAIEAYQRDLTIIEVTSGVPRAIFMLIMPTIRRRYRARELRRLARARKTATKSAPSRPTEPTQPAPTQPTTAQPTPTQPQPVIQQQKSGRSKLDKLLRRKRRDAIHRVRK